MAARQATLGRLLDSLLSTAASSNAGRVLSADLQRFVYGSDAGSEGDTSRSTLHGLDPASYRRIVSAMEAFAP